MKRRKVILRGRIVEEIIILRERKIDRNWWYIGYELVIVRVWSRGRGVENYSKGLRLLIGERGYCWCNGYLRKENRLIGRVGLLNKIFFLF